MGLRFRTYDPTPGFTADFHRVREFLVRANEPEPVSPGFHWGRWEWVHSLPWLDRAALGRIGIWEHDDRIVAVATYETRPGEAYLIADREHTALKPDMLRYAMDHLSVDGRLLVLLDDSDRPLQRFAFSLGMRPTQDKEANAVLDIRETPLDYTLPEGFRIVSLADEFDMRKFNQVLWNGFNHEDEGPTPTDEASLEERRVSVSGPHNDLNLKIAMAAPDGAFVSFCGMWLEPGTHNALVEPVATDPHYRRMGCGRAAVLEGVRRCGALGAKRAWVGSSQQFYYRLGFVPVSNETKWEWKK
jgi:GNAT superfamily N-acetyltransferase